MEFRIEFSILLFFLLLDFKVFALEHISHEKRQELIQFFGANYSEEELVLYEKMIRHDPEIIPLNTYYKRTALEDFIKQESFYYHYFYLPIIEGNHVKKLLDPEYFYSYGKRIGENGKEIIFKTMQESTMKNRVFWRGFGGRVSSDQDSARMGVGIYMSIYPWTSLIYAGIKDPALFKLKFDAGTPFIDCKTFNKLSAQYKRGAAIYDIDIPFGELPIDAIECYNKSKGWYISKIEDTQRYFSYELIDSAAKISDSEVSIMCLFLIHYFPRFYSAYVKMLRSKKSNSDFHGMDKYNYFPLVGKLFFQKMNSVKSKDDFLRSIQNIFMLTLNNIRGEEKSRISSDQKVDKNILFRDKEEWSIFLKNIPGKSDRSVYNWSHSEWIKKFAGVKIRLDGMNPQAEGIKALKIIFEKNNFIEKILKRMDIPDHEIKSFMSNLFEIGKT